MRGTEVRMSLVGVGASHMYMIPITTLTMSALITATVRGIYTQGTKIREAWEGDDPEVLGIDYVATIELGRSKPYVSG